MHHATLPLPAGFDPLPVGLDPGVLDRVTGTLLAQACGDALGVPYEFAAPPRYDEEIVMRGGGLGTYEPGEWSDDTQMAICVARVAAVMDLTADDPAPLDAVATAFEEWKADGASDIGRQTAAVLRKAQRLVGGPTQRLREASRAINLMPGITAGNGALMRAGVIGIVALDDRETTARTTRAVARLTHDDPVATDACALWSEAVRLAITEQRLDVQAGLDLIPSERSVDWLGWLTDAEKSRPRTGLRANGFCVTALQAAWHAITVTTPIPGPTADAEHVAAALQAVVRIGGDTDTIGAIAGSLLGARYGAGAIPAKWIHAIHGWPEMRARGLGALARSIVQRDLDTVDVSSSVTRCPLCATLHLPPDGYPQALCSWCALWSTDEAGHLVGQEGTDTPVVDRVWIDGQEYHAVGNHPDKIVILPLKSRTEPHHPGL